MHHVTYSKGGRRRVAIMWDSVTEPERVAETLKIEVNRTYAMQKAAGKRVYDDGDNQDWFGAPTVEILNERLTHGWPEGVKKLEQIATREINPVSIRRRRVRGDQGDELDMQAVYRGDISRAWTRTRRQSRAGGFRTITLLCNLNGSCGMSASKLFWRGAAVLKLADALTQAGYGVGIYGVTSSRSITNDGEADAAQFVEIKATDAPLDLSQLAALTAMPGWYRTRGFAGIITAADMLGSPYRDGLGRPAPDLMGEFAEALGLANCYIQPDVDNKDAAEKWIDEVMAKIETPELEAA